MYLVLLLILLAKIPNINPYTSAGIYAAAKFIMLLAFGANMPGAIISAAIGYALAFVYFLILRQLDRSVVLWFLVTVFGALLVCYI